MRISVPSVVALFFVSWSGVFTGAQTLVLDGTSGANTVTTGYDTTGGLTIELGFFADYLVVGGGSGSGVGLINNSYPGGGGGGSVVQSNSFRIAEQAYAVTVGAGGERRSNGQASMFDAVSAAGGLAATNLGVGGVSASGQPGGQPSLQPVNGRQGGGGGGDAGPGGNGFEPTDPEGRTGGTGGVGTLSTITGTSLMYGFGGGGGGITPGTNGDGTQNVSPRANSGGGAAGSGSQASGADGIVIVRYAGNSVGNIGGTVTAGTGTATGTTLHTFTTAGAATLDFGAVDFNQRLGVTVTGVISGSGDLVYVGPGRLTLAAATNTYTGQTVVENGTLQAGSTGAFGECPEIVLSNAAGAVLDLNNFDYTIKSLDGGGTTGGNVLLGSGTLSIGCEDGGAEFAGAISGTGRIVKIGTGTQTFTGANTYTGGTQIDAGVLAVTTIADSGPSALANSGTLLLNGGTLRYTGTTRATTARLVDIALGATNSAIDVSESSGHLVLTGNVWNSDVTHSNVVLNKLGSGTLEIAGEGRNVGLSLAAREGTTLLNGNTNTIYEIRALETNATVKLLRPNQVFSGDAIPTTGNIRMTGGTFDLNGFNQTVNRLTGAEFGTFGTGVITSAGPATFTFGSSLAGRPSDFAGTIEGALNVVTKGSNKVTLTGNNSYSGTTTISNANGTLQVGTNGTTGTLGLGSVSNNGTLIFNRSDDLPVANDISGSGRLIQQGAGTTTLTGANTYSGTTTISNGALQIGNGGTSGTLGLGAVTNNGTLIFNRSDEVTAASPISGAGNLVQVGSGTTTLTGTNSYAGTTAIGAGTLLLDGSHTGGASYTVAAGATLGGTGRTDSAVAVDGTIRPGDGTTQGVLQIGTLTLNNTGLLNILLGGATSSLLSVTGDISLLGGIDFTVAPALTADLYPLVSYTGSLSGAFLAPTNLPSGFNLVYGTNNTIFLERVPTIDGAAVLSQGDALITGGALNFDVLVYNNTASTEEFEIGPGQDTAGSVPTTTIDSKGDVLAQGMTYTGTNIGTNTGSYVITVTATGGTTSTVTNDVTVKVYDHAAGSVSGTNLSFAPVHVGYTEAIFTTNSVTVSNADGFRVDLKTTVTGDTNDLDLTPINKLEPGGSQQMTAFIDTGRDVGLFTNTLNLTFADDSDLNGASTNLGTVNVLVTGYIYSGQSTWTNNGTGDWTDFASWDVSGGTPGLDGVLSVNDTATFGAAGSGTVVLNTNASLLEVVFSNSSAPYNVNGSGTLTMAASGTNNPAIANQAGSHTIGTSVALPDDLAIETASGSSLDLTGAVSGAGSLIKNGAGTLGLSGNNTYAGGTTLNAGNLAVGSPTALGGGAVTLNAGTLTLESRIDIASLFWNGAATIAMANPAGGQFVNIANGLTLVNGINSFDLTGAVLPRSPVKLMTASNMGSLSVDLFGVVGLDRYTLLIEGDSLFITAKPSSYVDFAVTPNQVEIAGALDTFIDATSGDRVTVVDALDSLADNQFPSVFEQLMPTPYASLPTMAFNTANALNSGMFQRLWVIRINGQGFSAGGMNLAPMQAEMGGVDDMDAFSITPSKDTKWGTFVDGNGIFANGGDVNYLQNYRSQSGGVTAGASYKWNNNLATGVYAGYQGLQAEYSNGRTVDNAVRFGVFGTYDIDNFYINALVGGAYHGYTVNRYINFGGLDRTATGRPGAGEFDLALNTGYDFHAGNLSFGPFTGMQYTYVGVQGFTETGAGALNLDVDPYNTGSLLYTLGAQAAYNWKVLSKVIITPTIFAGWQHEFLQDAYQINSSFNTGGPSSPFSYTTGTPARDNFYGGVGATVGFGARWQATAIYSAFVGGQNQSSQNIYLGLGVRF